MNRTIGNKVEFNKTTSLFYKPNNIDLNTKLQKQFLHPDFDWYEYWGFSAFHNPKKVSKRSRVLSNVTHISDNLNKTIPVKSLKRVYANKTFSSPNKVYQNLLIYHSKYLANRIAKKKI